MCVLFGGVLPPAAAFGSKPAPASVVEVNIPECLYLSTVDDDAHAHAGAVS